MDRNLYLAALLGGSYPLPGGPRVRLRLARTADADGIRTLLERESAGSAELDLRRLLGFDPRYRVVICAVALLGSVETVLGVGAIELDGREGALPELLVVDRRMAEELRELLFTALLSRARSNAERRAA